MGCASTADHHLPDREGMGKRHSLFITIVKKRALYKRPNIVSWRRTLLLRNCGTISL